MLASMGKDGAERNAKADVSVCYHRHCTYRTLAKYSRVNIYVSAVALAYSGQTEIIGPKVLTQKI